MTSLDDLWVVAKTVYGEARGSTWVGQLAVAHVIQNRTRDRRWPGTPSAVCKQRKQFSCWNQGEVNNWPMLMADLDDPAFMRCYAAAVTVFCTEDIDATGGANHYHTDSISLPNWADAGKETGRIGSHIFYKL